MTSAPANAPTTAFWGPCRTAGSCPRDRAAKDDTAFIGGAQLGYNVLLQSFLIGVEGDLMGNSAHANRCVSLGPIAGFVPFTGTADTKVEWLSTLRGRLGILVTPAVLAYATGGIAYAGVERKFSSQFSPANPSGYFGKDEDGKFGWTVGGGLEWAIADRVTLGTEYLYVDLDAADQFVASGRPGVGGCTATNCIFTVQTSDIDMQIARLKLNFAF
jgi:outer membrane immunogenic protein